MKQFFTTHRRQFLFGLAAVLILCASIGGTIAWLTANSGIANTFKAPKPAVAIEETLDNEKTVKTNVFFENTGDVAMYYRAIVEPVWMIGADAVPPPEEEYTVTKDLGEDWFLGEDGYYYCSERIEPGGETPVLIKKWSVTTSATGYEYDVEVVVQGIQADGTVDTTGELAVTTVWPVQVIDGSLKPE